MIFMYSLMMIMCYIMLLSIEFMHRVSMVCPAAWTSISFSGLNRVGSHSQDLSFQALQDHEIRTVR